MSLVRIPLLESFGKSHARSVTAIHSGKLGDIIYSLPVCRLLGINHLILNVFQPQNEPLRWMSYPAIRELIPLLLQQPYLNQVSISDCNLALETPGMEIEGVPFNLDRFRNVAQHRVDQVYDVDPLVTALSPDTKPMHLVQAFAAALGTRVSMDSPWLAAPPSPLSRGKIVVSITQRWRSYPRWYWQALLEGLDNILFVGTKNEFLAAALKNATHIETKDHLELASLIAGCDLFLGTISFPYALAEGLKVNRGIEVCSHTLNAFPVGANGFVLQPDLLASRRRIESHLIKSDAYRATTASLHLDAFFVAKNFWNRLHSTRLFDPRSNWLVACAKRFF